MAATVPAVSAASSPRGMPSSYAARRIGILVVAHLAMGAIQTAGRAVHHDVRRPHALVTIVAALCACAGTAPAARPAEPTVDITVARARGAKQTFVWEKWSPEAFARAAREHRFILV